MEEKGQETQVAGERGEIVASLHCNIDGCGAQMNQESADLPTLEVIRGKTGEQFVRLEDLPRFAICKSCGYKARHMGAKTYRYADTLEELKRRAQEHAARTQKRDAIKDFFRVDDVLDGWDDRRPENHRR